MDNPEEEGVSREEEQGLQGGDEAGSLQQAGGDRYGSGSGGMGGQGGPSRQASMSNVNLAFSKVPVARKEEVQKLLGQCLVLKCDPNGPYLAPIVIMSADENNIYSWLENHLKSEYLMGAERFWKLVRSDMAIDTWRPRVQGAQLKALVGARLPETNEELAQVEATIRSLQDCLKQETNPENMMSELRQIIYHIQTWWENRNRRPDGEQSALKMVMVMLKQHGVNQGPISCLRVKLQRHTSLLKQKLAVSKSRCIQPQLMRGQTTHYRVCFQQSGAVCA
jgi:hypothetical protein